MKLMQTETWGPLAQAEEHPRSQGHGNTQLGPTCGSQPDIIMLAPHQQHPLVFGVVVVVVFANRQESQT